MPQKTVVAISGSPSPASKTSLLADYTLAKLAGDDIAVEHFRLTELDPAALLLAKWDDPGIKAYIAKIEAADGVVVATPIYKAAYSGLMKTALDILPQFGLAGKVALPLATGGSLAHVLALDYAVRPVLQSMGVRHVVQSCFVCEADIIRENGGFALSPATDAMLDAALENFRHSLLHPVEGATLGHPRPHEA